MTQTTRWLAVGALSAVCSAGCGQKRATIWSERGAAVVLKQAIEAPLPDTRREAVERIAASRYADTDVAVRTMDVVLTTDSSAIVRRAAARCLGISGRPEAWSPLLKVILQDQNDVLRAPDDRVLTAVLDTAIALQEQSIAPPVDADLLSGIRRLLAESPDRAVRVRAAKLLGYFPERPAVEALIEALDQGEFAVAYAAEASLRRLTGENLGYRAGDWRRWLEQVEDPIVPPGVNAQAQPSTPSWWGRLFN